MNDRADYMDYSFTGYILPCFGYDDVSKRKSPDNRQSIARLNAKCEKPTEGGGDRETREPTGHTLIESTFFTRHFEPVWNRR